MSAILIRNGRVIDPSQSIDRVANLLIRDGKIVALDADAASLEPDRSQGTLTILDADGKIVAPGLIDMHVHLREPGREEDETIETGTLAALSGGFTTIVCCPNTTPPIDSQGAVEFVRQKAVRADNCNVYVMGCVSHGREGKQLSEIGQLFDAGAVAFSDDGSPIHDPELMRRAFEYCLMFDKPVLSHSEVPELTKDGVMHEGLVSLSLGLRGIPESAESVMVSRDVTLAEATGGRLHVMHVSTDGSLQVIRRAKARNVNVTTEVTPHHFTLTDEALQSFDSNFKMNPPLRSEADRKACVEALVDGTIDVIASDHAPHAAEKKMRELDQAPFGIIGLETSLGLVVTQLIEPGILDWSTAIAKMTIEPAKILGLPKGTLKTGAHADVVIIDPDVKWEVKKEEFHSKSTNSPFIGWTLQGRAERVIVGGKVKFER
jgi:dihydroorotase